MHEHRLRRLWIAAAAIFATPEHERLNTELLELKAAKVARESGSLHKPKRLFRHAGKHEAKHEAAGLHLWRCGHWALMVVFWLRAQ